VYLTGTFDLGGAVLKSYTMYRDEKTQNYLDLDASSAPVFEGVFFLQNRTFSQEFNVSGSSDRLDWLAGLFYLNHKDSQGPFPVLFGPALVGGFGFPDGVIVDLYSAGVNIQAYAAYADLTYRLTDKLYATVGGRYSYEKSKAFWNVEPLAAGFGIGAGNPPGRVDFSNDWQDFSPRAVLRYELTPNSNIYASYSRGFKSGLLTPNGFTTTPLNPEKLDAFEIGYKYGDPRLQIALAAYYYDYKDQQLASFVSGTGVYVTADSKIYGAEASVTARITDALRVSAGLAYTHARYTEFPLSASYAPTPSGIFAATNVNAKGFQTQRSPDWTGNIAVDYEHPVGNDYTIGFNANAYFSSKFPFDTAEVFYEGAYALVNASVGFGPADKSWRISLYGRNLTDTEYRTQVLPGDFAIQQVFGEPLTYGAMVAFDF
jgi:iron complex outermembrane recepter protein